MKKDILQGLEELNKNKSKKLTEILQLLDKSRKKLDEIRDTKSSNNLVSDSEEEKEIVNPWDFPGKE
ncbi:hypothetical protein [Sulfuricurvum sp.]|uniref:hypothetical protein n=1 Tax=Sulfuricurvum sp. TaxID=2025608 RepID=UPI00261FC973|nr:hypothetical protein [Sulfuricurvum sp.]MDD3596175.1 hypothetical protein [Sulfuricurvum sp.]